MSKANNLTDFLTDLADTIRTKKGTSGLIDPQDFSSEIASIPTTTDTSGFLKPNIGYSAYFYSKIKTEKTQKYAYYDLTIPSVFILKGAVNGNIIQPYYEGTAAPTAQTFDATIQADMIAKGARFYMDPDTPVTFPSQGVARIRICDAYDKSESTSTSAQLVFISEDGKTIWYVSGMSGAVGNFLSGVANSFVSTTNVPITSGALISSNYGVYGMTVANGQSTNPGVILSRFGILRIYVNVFVKSTPSPSGYSSNYEYYYYYTQN